MKLFKWIKNHPIEAAAIAAAAAVGGPALFSALAPEVAAAGAGAGAAGAAGAGTAGMVAGDAFLPGMLAGTEGLAGGSALLGGLGAGATGWATGAGEALGGGLGASFGAPESSLLLGPMSGSSGGAGAFGLSGADVAGGSDWASGLQSAMQSNTNPAKPWLSGRQAMMLGQMAGDMGEQQQRPLGAPMMDAVPPMARQGMRTQEEITKAWLLKNDPATYARMYGMPPQMAQGGMYG